MDPSSSDRILSETAAWVRSLVSPARCRHVTGVAETARNLAALHGVDPFRAELAAWLHDCAKELPKDEMRRLIEESPWSLDPEEEALPALWHPHAGAWRANRERGVRDGEVLEAVRRHTLGHPSMSPLAQLLFVADYVEPGRNFPGVEEARAAARRSLSEAVVLKCSQTLSFLEAAGRPVHPRLRETLRAFTPARSRP